MASVASYRPAMRQPFASLDGNRLRNLANVKNQQNALPITLASPVKRRYDPILEDSDSENIDPSVHPSKKAKNYDENSVKPAKVSRILLKTQASVSRPISTPKRLDTSRATLKPAPSVHAAGRSPQRKQKSKNHRVSFAPPSLGGADRLFFSIDEAVLSTISTAQPEVVKPEPAQNYRINVSGEYVPKDWVFPIYEEEQIEGDCNVMDFSFSKAFYVSDDDSRAEQDDRGKENIPPANYSGPVMSRAASRKHMMTDEPRSPLGDLDASEFYADGCDASSFFIVPADDCETEKPCKNDNLQTMPMLQTKTMDLLAQVENAIKQNAATALAVATSKDVPVSVPVPEPEFEIWESESAKDDASPKMLPETCEQAPIPEAENEENNTPGAVAI